VRRACERAPRESVVASGSAPRCACNSARNGGSWPRPPLAEIDLHRLVGIRPGYGETSLRRGARLRKSHTKSQGTRRFTGKKSTHEHHRQIPAHTSAARNLLAPTP